jgi:hypothetical protein
MILSIISFSIKTLTTMIPNIITLSVMIHIIIILSIIAFSIRTQQSYIQNID